MHHLTNCTHICIFPLHKIIQRCLYFLCFFPHKIHLLQKNYTGSESEELSNPPIGIEPPRKLSIFSIGGYLSPSLLVFKSDLSWFVPIVCVHCFVALTAQQNQIALLLPVAVYVGLAICQLRMLSQMVYMMHQHSIMIFTVCFATLAFVVLLFAYGCSQLFPCAVIVKPVHLIGFNQAINFLYCHIIS